MFHWIRKTHLLTALVLFVFLLLYGVSGYILEFPSSRVFPGPATSQTFPFHYSGDPGAPQCVEYIKQAYDVHGQRRSQQFNRRTGRRDWFFLGPKASYQVSLSKNADRITITTSPFGYWAMLIRFHELSGFDGGWIYRVWGTIFDGACLAMLLFAGSGVYLWYKLTRRRTLGWIVLGSSIAYTAVTAFVCLCAK